MPSCNYFCYQPIQQKIATDFFLEINFMINTLGFLIKEQNKVASRTKLILTQLSIPTAYSVNSDSSFVTISKSQKMAELVLL